MTVLAATDGETVPDRTITVAADLADAYDDELVVLHVRDEAAEKGDLPVEIRQYDISSAAETEELVADAEAVARRVVSETVDDRNHVTTVGAVGEPAATIVERADEYDARYVVVGGRERSPVGKAVFGSVTQSVLLESSRPVVAVMHD